jgi:hypothetical protein
MPSESTSRGFKFTPLVIVLGVITLALLGVAGYEIATTHPKRTILAVVLAVVSGAGAIYCGLTGR